jgi:hypothetical protein
MLASTRCAGGFAAAPPAIRDAVSALPLIDRHLLSYASPRLWRQSSRRFPLSPARTEIILASQTGDDPTQPLGKIELLDRFTTTPGPGAVEGRSKQVGTNTPFARIEASFRIAPQWELAFRVEIPMVSTNAVAPENPSGQVVSGFGNVLTQGWLVYEINPRWARDPRRRRSAS